MKMAIVPRYADLFDEPIPDIQDLLKDISSEVIIGLLAMIQAKLHLANNEFVTQLEVLELFIQRQTGNIQQNIRAKILESLRYKGGDDFAIFSMHYTLEFMHYALTHYTELSMGEDTTPEQEYRMFKAYMIFIELRQRRDEQIFNQNKDYPADFFYKNTWPLMGGQYEASHVTNPFTEMVRGIVLFNFLEYSSPYAENVKKFLVKRGQLSSWNYVFALLNVVQQSWERVASQTGGSATRFSIAVTEEFEPIFSSFVMDVKAYALTYTNDHRNYSGLKDKPLFRFGQNSYLVLNWNFFYNKLYEGLLFDLYTHSDIKLTGSFKTFPNFKQYVSEAVTEGVLFKKLLCAFLQKKHSVLLFDEKVSQGFPDAYYRLGNNVILFEIKDAYFPAKAINTTLFQEIKDVIDEKYNQTSNKYAIHGKSNQANKDKGTGQLISQLRQMLTSSFETSTGYNRTQNLTIYPVMIYTDHFFSMPGINNYLQEAFDQKIIDTGLKRNFKRIRPLVFINIRFLINHVDLLRKKGTGLIELMELYYKEQIRAQKKVKRSDDLTVFFDCYQTFETAVKNKHENIMYRQEGFVQIIVDILNLTQGLPEGGNKALVNNSHELLRDRRK